MKYPRRKVDQWVATFLTRYQRTEYSHLSDKSRVHSHPKSLPFSGKAGLKSEPEIQFLKICKPEVSREMKYFFVGLRFLWYKESSEYTRLCTA